MNRIDWFGAFLLYICIVGTLKMTGAITWTWWMILAPFWLVVAAGFLIALLILWMFSQKGMGDWRDER